MLQRTIPVFRPFDNRDDGGLDGLSIEARARASPRIADASAIAAASGALSAVSAVCVSSGEAIAGTRLRGLGWGRGVW
jgi:hypothetical protein